MPDEQTDKVENTTDIDCLYTDREIFETTYIFRKILDSHLIENMETSGDTNEADNNRLGDSCDEDSDLVVVSVVLNKKQKENDEVTKAIERLQKNGVKCVCFTVNDARNGNLHKLIEAIENSKFENSSAKNRFTSPVLPELTPAVTTSTTAASAQVSEITSTLTTPTISDSIALNRCISGQKSPDITAISSSSSAARVSQSYIRSNLEKVAFQTECSVSSTPKLIREWEGMPKPTNQSDSQRSRSSTPPPPVLSPQVETETNGMSIEPISEPTISSCEKMDESDEKTKKKRRKRRRQSFFYRPAPKKKKVCPFAQAVVKGEMNKKRELEENAALVQPDIELANESPEVTETNGVLQEVILEESKTATIRKGERVRTQVNIPVTLQTMNKILKKPINGILKKGGKRKGKKKVVIKCLAVEKVDKVDVKRNVDFLQSVEVNGVSVDIVEKPNNVHVKQDAVAKAEVVEKLNIKSEIVKVKVVRKSKSRWKGKRARRKKKISQIVQPIRIKINGGILRAFSPDITTMMTTSLSLPPVVNCVQSISGKLDVQDDDKSIEDVQLQVDEIVKALESESGLEDEPDDYIRPIAQISCAMLEETREFSTKEIDPVKIKESEESAYCIREEQSAATTIKEESEDKKPIGTSALLDIKSDSIPDSPDAMQLRRSSFYSLISGNVRVNLEKYMDGRTTSCKTPKRRKRVKNGFLLHHGENYPEDPESPYKLHLATQVLLKLNKRRVKCKPKEDRGKSLLSYLKLAPKRSSRIGKGTARSQEEQQMTSEQLPLFSGEWTLVRKFICNICGHGEDCFWDLVHHKGENHPGVLATHVELTHPPPPGMIRSPPENSELNYPPPPCTKCSQKFSTFPDLHRHIFECAGNAAWLEEKTTRKKKAKRRRGFKRRLSNTPKKANNGKKAETNPKRRHSEVFKCEFCTREFKTEGWLKNHLVTHSLPVSIPLEKLSPPSRASLTSYRHVNVK